MSTRSPKIEAHITFAFDERFQFEELKVQEHLFGSVQPLLAQRHIDEACRKLRLMLDQYTRRPVVPPPDGDGAKQRIAAAG